MSDREKCETCGLTWGGRGSHPPCLKLPKDEQRAIVRAFYDRGQPSQHMAEGAGTAG